MDTPRISSASGHYISVDWSLIAITLVAVMLLVVTTVRTGPVHVSGTPFRSGGLEVLGAGETLIAFEDFSFGAPGWTTTAAQTSRADGPVYGPFDTGAATKDFAVPAGATQVRVGFDLYLTGDQAGDGFGVLIDGESVIERGTPLAASNAVVSHHAGTGAYAVMILLDRPGDAVSLEIQGAPGPDAAWAIDNVSVVASLPSS